MKRLTTHTPLLLAVALIVGLATLVAGNRTAEARAMLTDRLAEQCLTQQRLQRVLHDLRARQADTATLRERCEQYRGALPALSSLDATAAAIRQLANVSAVTISAVKPQASMPVAGIGRRVMRYHLRGSFNGIYALLTQVETLSPTVLVSDLRLRRSADRDGDLAAELTVQMLFQISGGSNAQAGRP